ncbi:uncharacterized protein ltc4s isoform X2 [Scleropages formosus]|uniref:uncharacterized protein ltc4s isoform X2 n=1 Tax=Scleropages formosus TaxID=113540 RepID=UPI000877EAED|nr:leukotriene C4 synthase isoform X2 [Scleropages formosus]
MLEEVVCVAAVTVLGVLEQAYFSLQVIYARRKYSVSPPATAGPPEFERVFRAHCVLRPGAALPVRTIPVLQRLFGICAGKVGTALLQRQSALDARRTVRPRRLQCRRQALSGAGPPAADD